MTLSRNKPCIMVIDECQALDVIAPSFWADLQEIWDLGKDASKLLLVMSDSIATAIRHIFNDASEPLFGRTDLFLTVQPFRPPLLQEIFRNHNPQGSGDDLLTLYATTGGVASYAMQLIERTPLTKDDIIEYIYSPGGSALRNDANTVLTNEFRMDSPQYFKILRAIANGATKWTEISDVMEGKDISGYMDRLNKQFNIISKISPLYATGTRGIRYEIRDLFFRFYFQFVEPPAYSKNIEFQNWEPAIERCLRSYDQFSGRALESWFHDYFATLPRWDITGRWWDRRGENEIDLIGINDRTSQIDIFEIKRNPKKIDLNVLAAKAVAFEQACAPHLKGLGAPHLKGLSLEDVLKTPEELFKG